MTRLLICCFAAFSFLSAQAPAKADLAALWVEPGPNRDLFYGVGGRPLAPDPSATYSIISVKKWGFSGGYKVRDAEGSEWSVKLYPEARTEVGASRITGVSEGLVTFDYRGRFAGLFKNITVSDVQWICGRLAAEGLALKR